MKFLDTGELYTPAENDVIRFTVKRNYSDARPLITKIVPNDTQMLHLTPEDTKPLAFGSYVYEIELTNANNDDVDTFIAKASLIITEEVGE